MSWQAVAKSVIGAKHQKTGQPCQDCGSYAILPARDIIIGAVSDGMGSAKHSDVGSSLAVDITLNVLKRTDWSHPPKDAGIIFDFVLNEVQSGLRKEAESKGYTLHDLACTLLAFVATPKWLAAMQVGDGFIVLRSKDQDYKLLFEPDKGEFANETTPVTSSNAKEAIQVTLKQDSFLFICASTDGIENISLIKSENWKPSHDFFSPLEKDFCLKKSQKFEEELEDALGSKRINQHTDDDKTLLICVYSKCDAESEETLNNIPIVPPPPPHRNKPVKLRRNISPAKGSINIFSYLYRYFLRFLQKEISFFWMLFSLALLNTTVAGLFIIVFLLFYLANSDNFLLLVLMAFSLLVQFIYSFVMIAYVRRRSKTIVKGRKYKRR